MMNKIQFGLVIICFALSFKYLLDIVQYKFSEPVISHLEGGGQGEEAGVGGDLLVPGVRVVDGKPVSAQTLHLGDDRGHVCSHKSSQNIRGPINQPLWTNYSLTWSMLAGASSSLSSTHHQHIIIIITVSPGRCRRGRGI